MGKERSTSKAVEEQHPDRLDQTPPTAPSIAKLATAGETHQSHAKKN